VLLSEGPFKKIYRAFDSEWKMEVAWNVVCARHAVCSFMRYLWKSPAKRRSVEQCFVSLLQVMLHKMPTSTKMHFLSEVNTLVQLTNEQVPVNQACLAPSRCCKHDGEGSSGLLRSSDVCWASQPTWLRYTLIEDKHGNLRMKNKWELTQVHPVLHDAPNVCTLLPQICSAQILEATSPMSDCIGWPVWSCSQANPVKEMLEQFTPRSVPVGEAFGPTGLREQDLEAQTGQEAWRCLKCAHSRSYKSDWC
jgi:hypothetical protein